MVEIDRVDFKKVDLITIIRSFIMGVRFDVVISSYILSLPALLFFIMEISNKVIKPIKKIFFYWIVLLFSMAFLISAVDIPYFTQFYSRFSVSAFEWLDSPKIVFNMIIQEPRYFMILIPLVLFIVVFYKLLKRIFTENSIGSSFKISYRIIISLFFLGLNLSIKIEI